MELRTPLKSENLFIIAFRHYPTFHMSGERQDKKVKFGRLFSFRSQDHPESREQRVVAAQGPVYDTSGRPNRNTVPPTVQSTSIPITLESFHANGRDWDNDDERSGIPGGWQSANLNPQFRDGIYPNPSVSTSSTDDLLASSKDTTLELESQRPSQHHDRSSYGRKLRRSHEPTPLSPEGPSSPHSTRTRTRAINLSESDNRTVRDPRTPTAESVEMDSTPMHRISPHDTSPDNLPANPDEADEELARVLEESRLEFEMIEQTRLVFDQHNAPSYSPLVGSYSQPVAGNDNLEEDEEFLRVLEESRLEALAVEESLRGEAEALERSRLEAIRQSCQEALDKSRAEAQEKKILRLEAQSQERKRQEEVEGLARFRPEKIRQSRIKALDRSQREAQAKEQQCPRINAKEQQYREAQVKDPLRPRVQATERLRLEAEAKEKQQLRLEVESKEQLRLKSQAKEKVRLEVETKEQSNLETFNVPLVKSRFVSGRGVSPKPLDHFIPPRTNPRTLKAMLSPSESREADGRDPETSLLHSILSPSQIEHFNSASDNVSPRIGTTGHSQTNVSAGVRSAPYFDFPSTTFVPPKDVSPSTKPHLESIQHTSPSLFNSSTIGEGTKVGTVDNAFDSDYHSASTIFSASIMASKYGYPESKSPCHASSDAVLFPSLTFLPPTNIILSASDLENIDAMDPNTSKQPEAKQPESSTDFHTTFAHEDHYKYSNAFFPNTMESTTHNDNLSGSNFVGSERLLFQSLPREFDTTVSNSDDAKDVFIPPPDSTLPFKFQNLHHLKYTIATSTGLPETHNNKSSSIS